MSFNTGEMMDINFNGIRHREKLLRRLMNCGEYFESHVLHIYFLAVPDFVGVKSVLPLVNTHKDVVIQALKLKKLGHYVGDVIGGRLIHYSNKC